MKILKKPRYFATHEAMTDVQLAHGLELSMEDRLRELRRLNRIAFTAAYGSHQPRKRLAMYTQQPNETFQDFFSRTEKARQKWTSLLKNSAIL